MHHECSCGRLAPTSRSLLGWQVELTSVRYPHLKRGQYARLTEADVAEFRRVLGAERVLTDDLDGYNTDWMRSVRGEMTPEEPDAERAGHTRVVRAL